MHVDFIDIGSSKGGSIRFAQRHFGTGYGIDIDPRKVKQAQQAGFDCRLMDIQDVQDTATWVTCLHVIEHLQGREQAREMISRMLEIGDNVYISFPYFNSDAYLYNLGYKLFWSDWTGHPYHCTTLEMHNILRDLRQDYTLELYKPITSTMDDAVIPITAPKDSLGYTNIMDEKEDIPLENVYREVRYVIGDNSLLKKI